MRDVLINYTKRGMKRGALNDFSKLIRDVHNSYTVSYDEILIERGLM